MSQVVQKDLIRNRDEYLVCGGWGHRKIERKAVLQSNVRFHCCQYLIHVAVYTASQLFLSTHIFTKTFIYALLVRMDRMDVGSRLKKMRLEIFGEDQSLIEFQARSGVSRGSVKNVEEGISYPRLDILEKWLKACGTDIPAFFASTDKPDRHASMDRMVAVIFNSGEEKVIDTLESNITMSVNEVERLRSERERPPVRSGRRRKQH